jgi:hypothetical protein
MGACIRFPPDTARPTLSHRQQAKTPIIAGSICAVLLVIGWSVALISYLVRRRKKKTRAKKVAAGMKPPKPVPQPPEKYIIPPDPAVVLGQRQPGEHVVVESKYRRSKHGRHVRHSRKIPEAGGPDGDRGGEPNGKLTDSNTESDSPHQGYADDDPLTKRDTT